MRFGFLVPSLELVVHRDSSMPLRARNSKRQTQNSESAFTLIEILVVVAILAIILTIGIPFMNSAVTGAKGINGAMRMMQEASADARALAILRHTTVTMTIDADGNINVSEGATRQKSERLESLDVAGNEWRMEDRPAVGARSGGVARGGRVEMKHKYPVKLPDGVVIEALSANGLADAMHLEMVEVRFYADGTSDEFNVILTHPESGESRQIWLEITTGLADFETDKSKFRLH